jgi:hopene-associated glycosyltransferase HpnB
VQRVQGWAGNNMVVEIIAFPVLAAWSYLAIGRGAFWRCAERDSETPPAPQTWPRLAVVIPARDEADGIGNCLESLFRQDYPGSYSVVLVDDNSSDGTADVARRTALMCGARDRLTVVSGALLPRGWTGKLWALHQGIEAAMAFDPPPQYLLLSDADIVYTPTILGWLVAHATARGQVLTSLMVKLRCESLAERFLIPAFIFFFQMLYPFAWVNRRDHANAAAAGGCMLVHARTLREAGGIDAIRDALIDDCALARMLKAKGRIWLGLTERVASIRGYPGWSDIGRMISRSAYAQLGYSPVWLAVTVVGMALVFLVPPAAALVGSGYGRLFGVGAWLIMAVLFWPTLRLYRRSPLWGLALPAISCAYLMFTINSALLTSRGKGGLWKGRFQAVRAK